MSVSLKVALGAAKGAPRECNQEFRASRGPPWAVHPIQKGPPGRPSARPEVAPEGLGAIFELLKKRSFYSVLSLSRGKRKKMQSFGGSMWRSVWGSFSGPFWGAFSDPLGTPFFDCKRVPRRPPRSIPDRPKNGVFSRESDDFRPGPDAPWEGPFFSAHPKWGPKTDRPGAPREAQLGPPKAGQNGAKKDASKNAPRAQKTLAPS